MGIRDIILGRPSTTSSAPAVTASSVTPFVPAYRNQAVTQIPLLNVSRREAMSVPAIARARNLIANTIAGMPLYYYVDDELRHESRMIPRLPWMRQFEPNTPRATTLAYLIDSMLFFGRGYLRVLDVYEEDGRPRSFEWIDPAFVTFDVDQITGRITRYYVNLTAVPRSGVGSLIVFVGPDEGILVRGGNTIRTCVELERAARNFAEAPTPAVTLKNEGMDLPADQVDTLLTRWRESRRNSTVGYLSSALSIQTHGFSPSDMTLVDSQKFMVEQVARLTGIPPWYIGAETGSSMTYSNLNSSRRDLIDLSLAPFETAIEQRLSMDDITPRGHHVQFSYDDFLRSTPIERAQLLDALVRNGILTPEEARDRGGFLEGPL
jgi:hypothetical protein